MNLEDLREIQIEERTRSDLQPLLDSFYAGLESILEINKHSLLKAHDSRVLEESWGRLKKLAGEPIEESDEVACLEFDAIVQFVASTLGRNKELDQAIKGHRKGHFNSENLQGELGRWCELIEYCMEKLRS